MLVWQNEKEKANFSHKVKKFIKHHTETSEKDIIDIDILLSLYLEDFITKKKQIQAKITKEFMKIYSETEGILNCSEIEKVISSAIGVTKPSLVSPYVAYTGEISILRSFLYALTSSDNGFDIKCKDFTNACSKYGVDSPFPTVASRLYYFGTDSNVEELISYKFGDAAIAVGIFHGDFSSQASPKHKQTASKKNFTASVKNVPEKKEDDN